VSIRCMALAAKEILAIPASEVDCERLFSQGRDLLAVRRYAMSGETMRIMMLLKGALRSLQGLLTEGEVKPKPTYTGYTHTFPLQINKFCHNLVI
jgi:hypothetical protein